MNSPQIASSYVVIFSLGDSAQLKAPNFFSTLVNMVALFVSLLILSSSLPILWNLHLEDREEKAEGEKTEFFSVGGSNVE